MTNPVYNLANPTRPVVIFEPDDQSTHGIAKALRHLDGLAARGALNAPAALATGFWQGIQSTAVIMYADDFARHDIGRLFAAAQDCVLTVVQHGGAYLLFPDGQTEVIGPMRQIAQIDPEGCTLYDGKVWRAGPDATPEPLDAAQRHQIEQDAISALTPCGDAPDA